MTSPKSLSRGGVQWDHLLPLSMAGNWGSRQLMSLQTTG